MARDITLDAEAQAKLANVTSPDRAQQRPDGKKWSHRSPDRLQQDCRVHRWMPSLSIVSARHPFAEMSCAQDKDRAIA